MSPSSPDGDNTLGHGSSMHAQLVEQVYIGTPERERVSVRARMRSSNKAAHPAAPKQALELICIQHLISF